MAVEHGTTSISTDGDIITMKPVGAFNREGTVKAIENLTVVIEGFSHHKFKLLFDYTEVEGGTPDVFEKIDEFNLWLNNQNMIAKALIINSSAMLEILESKSPARKFQNTKNFDNEASALNWLEVQK